MENKPYIIAVDDTPFNLESLTMILMDIEAEIECAESGAKALELIEKRTPDLVLLDIIMPKMNGYEVCRVLRTDPKTSNVPIIFVSAYGNLEDSL